MTFRKINLLAGELFSEVNPTERLHQIVFLLPTIQELSAWLRRTSFLRPKIKYVWQRLRKVDSDCDSDCVLLAAKVMMVYDWSYTQLFQILSFFANIDRK